MQQPPRRGEPEIDLEQILGRINDFFKGIGGRFGGGGGRGVRDGDRAITIITFVILGIALILWLSTGIYLVNAGEQGVLRTFGQATSTTTPGLHWHWPAPIGTRNVESVQQTRSMELGFSIRGDVTRPVIEESQMIAGDLNIVDVPLVVQYRIRDLTAFLFNVADPGEGAPNRLDDIQPGRPEGRTLKDATEAALRLVVGQRPIDDVLTGDKKEVVQADVEDRLQGILDKYGTGIQVIGVRLQEVKPPEEVRDAFDDVVRARSDKETAINQARAVERDILPRARGNAERILQGAEAFRRERIAAAEGEAGRFLAVLAEYEKAQDVTRQRLYLEAMEDILPGITKFIVDPNAGGAIILNASGNVVTPGGSSIVPVPQIQPQPTAAP